MIINTGGRASENILNQLYLGKRGDKDDKSISM